MAGFDRLHPAVQHHVVNTLGLARRCGRCRSEAIEPILGRRARPGARPDRRRQDRGGGASRCCRGCRPKRWRGLSVLYVCPLRALLNNLHPRLERYAGFVGLRAGLWHGDVGAAAREPHPRDPPDILLTTPESLEAMLVSARRDHAALLRRTCAPSSSTRSTPSPATTAAGTCWPCSSGSPRWPAATSSASACRPRSATRTSCSPGCAGSSTGAGPGRRPRPSAPRRTARGHARLRRLARQRRHGDLRPAPRREAARLLRQPGTGRGARRRRCASDGVDDVRVALVAGARRAPAGRGGVRRGHATA